MAIDFHSRRNRSTYTGRQADAGWVEAIRRIVDPAMFETDLGHGFTTLFDSIGWGPDMARKFSLNSVEGSWLDESDKSALAHGVPSRDRRPRQGIRLPDRRADGLILLPAHGDMAIQCPAIEGETVGCPCFSSVQGCSACLPCP